MDQQALNDALKSGAATVETPQTSDSSQSAPTEASSNKAAPEEAQSAIDQFIPILVALQSTQKFLSSAPTFTPQTFQDQIQFGYDGSVYRLYVWVNNTWQTVVLGGSLVQRIIAGTGISVSPSGGTGIVTVNSTFQGKFAHGVAQWISSNTGTQQLAHGLGIAPAYVRITHIAFVPNGGGPNEGGTGTYDAANNQTYALWYGFNGGGSGTYSTDVTNIVTMSITQGSNQAVASVSSVDATNINLSWSKTGSPTNTIQMLWEAWA